MSAQRRSSFVLAALTASALALPLAAGATSYLPIADRDLAEQAAVIVQATVLASEPAPIAGPPSTDYFIQVERVLEGWVAGSTVVVRVPGGIGPDGVGLRIWGAPSFAVGERVVLFLTPRRDGTYAVLHLMLGAFHEVQAGGRRLALRNLNEASSLAPQPGLQPAAGVAGEARDFEAFVDWLAEREHQPRRPASYFLSAAERADLALGAAPAVLTDRCTGLGLRWFEFDKRRRVPWTFDVRGFDGAGSGQLAFARARAAWRRGRVRLTAGGETRAQSGLRAPDGLNTLLFSDPGDEIAGSFRCTQGGILAVAGVWYDNGRNQECQVERVATQGRFRDRPFLKILGADVVTNDGSACYFYANPAGTAEVFARELGHALGLAWAGASEALLDGPVHADGRGPALHPADLAALARLYD